MKWAFQFLTNVGATDIFGEIGVIFNEPQPFTVRTRKLCQVIRISHTYFKQTLQPLNRDGKTILANFVKQMKGLNKDMLDEIPCLSDLQDYMNIEHSGLQDHEEASQFGHREHTAGIPICPTFSNHSFPVRLVIHGDQPDKKTITEGERTGKLIHLPESIEDLLSLAENKFGKRGNTVVMADGSEVEDLSALRENDELYIF